MDIEQLLKRLTVEKNNRGDWENHWESLARVLHQRRMGFTSSQVDGARRTEELFDSTPMQARRGLSAAIDGLIKPKTSQWVFVKAVGKDIEDDAVVRQWQSDAEDALLDELYAPKGRFQQASGETDDDLVTFGTGLLWMEESADLTHTTYRSLHLKNVYLMVDAIGLVRGCFICYSWEASQADEFFRARGYNPGKAVSEAIQDKEYSKKIEFVQMVVRRPDRDVTGVGQMNMPFASVWCEVSEKEKIYESGFDMFPLAAPRWDTASGERYGRSPGMIALPDSNTLNAMGKTLLKGGQMAVLPPMFAPADSIVGQARLISGKFTFYDLELAQQQRVSQPIFPMNTGTNLPVGREMQGDYREMIWRAFFKNVLSLPVEGPQMTATEVLERKEEFIRTIGPVFGRLETDYLAPVVENTFHIMLKNNRLPPIPEILSNRDIRFEYRSPVERVRKQIDAAAAAKTVEHAVYVAKETGDMSPLDWLDYDKFMQLVDEANGSNILLPESVVKQKREQRAQAQVNEQEKMDAERAVAAGVEVAKATPAMASAFQG